NVYSAPINDHRVAVPVYPQLVDPTLQPSEQSPSTWPAPGLGQVSGAMPLNGHTTAGASGPADGGLPYVQPAAAGLQGVTSGGPVGPADPSGGPVAPGSTGPRHPGGGQIAAAAAAAGVPIMTSLAGGDDSRRARRSGGIPPGGGRTAGGYSGTGRIGAGAGGGTEFGPRPSSAAAPVAESRLGAGLGRGASGLTGGRAGQGDLMAPIGGGRGNGGEDTERRRPSYLIEVDDIFTDGRKVAPPVIGEDSPDREG
ncbi:MAG: hypothetical protein ACRDTZ_10820, partial [Pseudonocardiaceae bacterium]